jgi:hypothetical protein
MTRHQDEKNYFIFSICRIIYGVFIAINDPPCFPSSSTHINLMSKNKHTLTFIFFPLQKDHILVDPTGSDISNCISKGKSQVNYYINPLDSKKNI